MVKVGDRIRLSSGKGPYSDGIVTAVAGLMVRVRWSSEAETTIIPCTGDADRGHLIGRSGARAGRREGGRPKERRRQEDCSQESCSQESCSQESDDLQKGAGKKGAGKKGARAKRS
jgi:hypothetical protein